MSVNVDVVELVNLPPQYPDPLWNCQYSCGELSCLLAASVDSCRSVKERVKATLFQPLSPNDLPWRSDPPVDWCHISSRVQHGPLFARSSVSFSSLVAAGMCNPLGRPGLYQTQASDRGSGANRRITANGPRLFQMKRAPWNSGKCQLDGRCVCDHVSNQPRPSW